MKTVDQDVVLLIRQRQAGEGKSGLALYCGCRRGGLLVLKGKVMRVRLKDFARRTQTRDRDVALSTLWR